MKNQQVPVVSIIMATYNRANQISQTIKNIFEQSYKEIELIVINDGSSDDTLATIHQLQSKFDFIIINNSKNLGLQKSLNIGIKNASGKFIARIDDHDKWIDIDKLSKQVSYLEAHPNVGVLGTGYRIGNKAMLNPLTDNEIRNQILMRSPFCHVSVLIVKEILDLVGGYDETLSYSEDWDLWLKIGNHAHLSNLPDITVALHDEDTSLSREFYLKQMPINRQIVKQHYNDYPLKMRAQIYHQFIRYFFAIFPLNGSMHKLMKIGFQKYFALSPNKNTFHEPTAK